MHFDCTATFALNIGLSDAAGTNLIHEALELRHRLPRTWARVKRGEVTAWRARRIAAEDHVSTRRRHPTCSTPPWPGSLTKSVSITLDRLIEEAKMRLHPIETEQAQIDRLERREVWLDPNMSHEGVAHMEIRADFVDLFAFDKTVSDIATALGDLGNTDDLDVRRSLAIGVLADPQQAADLLAGDADALKKPSKRKQIQLVVHLTDESLNRENPVGRLERNGGMPILEQQVRAWCGRTDTGVTITPLIDLAESIAVPQYEVPDRIKAQVEHRDITCVFPHCTRPALRSDKDHIDPHEVDDNGNSIGGQTEHQSGRALPKTPPSQNPRRLVLPTSRTEKLPLDQPIRPAIPPRPRRHVAIEPTNKRTNLPRAG